VVKLQRGLAVLASESRLVAESHSPFGVSKISLLFVSADGGFHPATSTIELSNLSS
jgi:hypothetical protein